MKFSLTDEARKRVELLLLDAFVCSIVSRQFDPHPAFVDAETNVEGDALVWFDGRRTDPAHAALVNGTVAHHAEFDDGNPRAGLHGGVTVIPAAFAVAETVGASGPALLDAIAFGYAAAVAYGRPLLERIEHHRLHPPSMVGCFGAAGAAARLMRVDDETLEGAIALAGTLMPLGPFESFTKGAPVKDLYGGYPAYVGVRAAQMAQSGITGPLDFFEPDPLDPNEVLNVYIKPWPSCRATHAALSALLHVLPIEKPVRRVVVETYRFAAELSDDADPSTPIGAKASIPAMLASFVGQPIKDRVEVVAAPDIEGRGARITITFEDGTERSAAVDEPRSEPDPRAKFREFAGRHRDAIEEAVARLNEASDLSELVSALGAE